MTRALLHLILLSPLLPAQPAERSLEADLSSGWRMIEGDNPAFAQAGGNTGTWKSVTLPVSDLPFGMYWLTRTIQIPAGSVDAPQALVLGTMPGEYEVYLNGLHLGSTPNFRMGNVVLPCMYSFPIPAGILRSSPTLYIAFRMDVAPRHASSEVVRTSALYRVTSLQAAKVAVAGEIDRRRVATFPRAATLLLDLVFAAALFFVWRNRGGWTAALWLGSAFVSFAASSAIFLALHWSTIYPTSTDLRWVASAEEGTFYLGEIAILGFTLAMINRVSRGWLILPVLFFPAICAIPYFPGRPIYILGDLSTLGVAGGLAVWRILAGRQTGAGIFALILAFCGSFLMSSTFHFTGPAVSIGPLVFRVDNWAQVLIGFLMMADVLRRSAADWGERQRLGSEMESARAVQSLLLNAQSSPGGSEWAIDARYVPAQEVGGDFYWSRVEPDGARLILIGDVSGKGLKAAMLVSLIHGALERETETSPAALLSNLNEVVCTHLRGGFVTACCARAEPGGCLRIANAGHVSPYAQGLEVEVAAGLPLGVVRGVEYSEVALPLQPGSAFTLLTDGVPEATNAQPELFGFDRTCGISQQSAQEIVSAAQAWGQSDDITVVKVRRAK
ncbi:MAG: serine/threonine-protein phosphatase [Acidobacteria bacterium]|nr:serine/threonine-protein phosphatase [Acidobacteriota bacterium]